MKVDVMHGCNMLLQEFRRIVDECCLKSTFSIPAADGNDELAIGCELLSCLQGVSCVVFSEVERALASVVQKGGIASAISNRGETISLHEGTCA